jgi:TolB-like protein/Tfp pilus assembly protein PilF
VAAAYGIVAWLLVEMASVVLPALRLPEWTLTLLVFLVVAGFPLALILAWAFELTPEGIKRETAVDPAESITQLTGRKLDFAIIGLLAVAVVYFAVDKFVLKAAPEQAELAADQAPAVESVASGKSVAVLPFANMSQDAIHEPFTNGIYDDILTQISKIRDLKVIARTTMERLDPNLGVKEIGTKLSVAAVLEGGVQRVGDRIRVNVQLNDCETEAHLWAETYDRELTASNIFAIQSEIATAVADSLRAELSPEEKERLASGPTENLAAYEAYLLGKQHLGKGGDESKLEAIGYFQQAAELDPSYSLAYVGLADTYILRVYKGSLPVDDGLAKAQIATDMALELNDQLGEAYNSLAGIKEERGDFEGAEAAYQRALKLSPNYSTAYNWYGVLLHDELGRFKEALSMFLRAAELDPFSANYVANVGHALESLGRFEEALVWLERSLELDPVLADSEFRMGEYHWLVTGRVDQAVVWHRQAVSLDPANPAHPASLGAIFLDLGDFGTATYWSDRAIALGPDRQGPNRMAQLLHLYQNDEAALMYARKAFSDGAFSGFFLLLLRDRYLRAGQFSEARALYEEARPELFHEDAPQVNFQNWPAAINLAPVLIKTGEQKRADLLLEKSWREIQTMPRRGINGYGLADVEIYALRGEKQKALSALRQAIDEGWRTLWWYSLKQDPSLESLHGEPDFQAMVAEIEADMAVQLARVREMERNGELEPIPEVSATSH